MNTQVQNDNVVDGFKEELDAMQAVGNALQSLKQDGRKRVLQWAASHFLAADAGNVLNFPKLPSGDQSSENNAGGNASSGYADLPTFFDAASPKTGVDKALVVGYWMQECQGSADFVSQDINTELKHLGHGVGNITDAFNGLISQKLVMQIRKSGVTKQARKKYKLTREGIKRVQQMLQTPNDE